MMDFTTMENKRVLLKTRAKNANSRGWILILYFCGFGGLTLGLTGLFLSGLAFFRFAANTAQINRIGTWLMVAAFPVVILGAHAMDKIAEIRNAEKRRISQTENGLQNYSPLQWR